jgi:hypothetical protein
LWEKFFPTIHEILPSTSRKLDPQGQNDMRFSCHLLSPKENNFLKKHCLFPIIPLLWEYINKLSK